MTADNLDLFIKSKEDEHCEFKAAKTSFSFDHLVEYCVAIANELGGRLALGIQNKPRQIVGSSAFRNLEETKHKLLEAVKLRIEAEEIKHPQGRVVIFTIPPRPLGMPLHIKGRYLMRSGESLVAMSPDHLQRIFAETGPDFSLEVCEEATLYDLEPLAIQVFRNKWLLRSNNAAIATASMEQLLEDSELLRNGKITYACLALMGSHRALGIFLPNAEIIYEYRTIEGQIATSQRIEYRTGFLAIHDDIWQQVNARNDIQSIREGMFRMNIPAFAEDAVREAVLNAVTHRDYRLGGSVFIRQYPKRLEIISPGGFPTGITPANILKRQSPRNRRLAEACGKCGLVERSGQGMDRIYSSALRQGKAQPQFTGTDDYQVALTMFGEVVDPRYLRLLDLARQHNIFLDIDHLIALDHIRQGQSPTPEMLGLMDHLIKIGLVEQVGRGRGSKVILSRGMYRAMGEPGTYTRYHGLDRETNKQLIYKHIENSRGGGATLQEFRQVVPQLTVAQIRHLVYELKNEGKIDLKGWARHSRWFLSKKP